MKSTAKTTATLPEGYETLEHIDLKQNKKQFWTVNLLCLAVILVMLLPVVFTIPFSTLIGDDLPVTLLKVFSLCLSLTAYVLLHELVHGIFMKSFSGVKPHYGLSFTYAYAGSTAYFNRTHYIIIALAPVVIWGIVLGFLIPIVPLPWFWVPYLVQIMNLSGAAGDLYVTFRMCRMPADILVQDSGATMTVYSRSGRKE